VFNEVAMGWACSLDGHTGKVLGLGGETLGKPSLGRLNLRKYNLKWILEK
jgi:hypothetical protein